MVHFDSSTGMKLGAIMTMTGSKKYDARCAGYGWEHRRTTAWTWFGVKSSLRLILGRYALVGMT